MDADARFADRFRALDARPVQLDGVAVEEPELGLAAQHSPYDPAPSVVLGDGNIAELDGTRRERFDIIDAYIADFAIDREASLRAMPMPDRDLAAMIVDPGVPRAEVLGVMAGLSPAKLAAVVRQLQPPELLLGLTKMRSRAVPHHQAQVTNRLDDPLLLAADTACAVAHGFREISTTVPVSGDAASNAIAVLIGSHVGAVGSAGALTQCAVDEATQLRLGMRGLTSFADSMPLEGSELGLLGRDDTPWSKAFLVAAYASRGVKLRVSAGGGAEAMSGTADGRSVLYLQARTAMLAKAIGAQGLRNGGAQTAALVAALPGGVLELHQENLLAMLLGLESCAGADALVSNSEARRFGRSLPSLLAGADCLAGFGAVARYDNVFGAGNLNLDDLDDYLLLQRDWAVDGGLVAVDRDELIAVRRRAAEACRAVYSWLGLGDFSEEHVEAVVGAEGSADLPQDIGLAVLAAAQTIDQQAISGLDVAAALEETGYTEEAERIIALLREEVRGDLLQTAAMVDGTGAVRSAVTDPNRYSGPGSGYRPGRARQARLDAVRQQRSLVDIRDDQTASVQPDLLLPNGWARPSDDPRDVVVALSPAFATSIWRTIGGHPGTAVVDEVLAGLEEEGCLGRVVRVKDTADLGRIGFAAAQLAGSGIAIALEGSGAITVTRRGLSPLSHLERHPAAAQIALQLYRQLAVNAARHAKGSVPQLVRNTAADTSTPADFHTRLVGYLTLEREQVVPGGLIELLEVDRD